MMYRQEVREMIIAALLNVSEVGSVHDWETTAFDPDDLPLINLKVLLNHLHNSQKKDLLQH